MAEKKEVVIISKMSVAMLKCNPRVAAVGKDEPAVKVPICRIYGKADGTKATEDKVTGTIHVALTGLFEGENLKTGDIYRSGKLYLPKGVHEMVESAVAKLDSKAGDTVNFALEISVVTATNPIGYSYESKNLIATKETDELESLRNELPAFVAPKALGDGKPAKK